MSAIGRLTERMAPLPPASTRRIVVERDLRITMDDGEVLLADRWTPRLDAGQPIEDVPVVLVRTAYGRGGPLAWLYGPAVAERGLQVVIVSSRGTFGSGGEFVAMRDERDDGRAVLRWLGDQPWAAAGVILAGSSYFGYTQWAVAKDAPPIVKAMVPHITSSRLATGLSTPGRFQLDTLAGFSWNTAPQARRGRPLAAAQERPGYLLRAAVGADRRHIDKAMNALPLSDVDTVLLGRQSELFQEVLRRDQDSDYWTQTDHSPRVGDVSVPVSLVAGWYDTFLVDQMKDYADLVAAGQRPRLTIGPWWHADLRGMAASVSEAVGWAASVARGQVVDEPPVSIYVMGADEWRSVEEWPPAGYAKQTWRLGPDGTLGATLPASARPTTFVYDPADPTPSLGGPKLTPSGAGPVDNREVEARDDVLTFTSRPLSADLEVIGVVEADVWVRSDRPNGHVFVRLCDVDEDGQSINICDELVYFEAEGVAKVSVSLSPTAQVFKAGHSLRLQVSGGAFPRFARNLGGNEAIASATAMHRANVEVFHDDNRPSAVHLPARTSSR